MNVTRSIKTVPNALIAGLLLLLMAQAGLTWKNNQQQAVFYTPLSAPQSKASYQLLSLNSLLLAGHLLTLKVQLHDNQQGRHINYSHVSYPRLSQWLLRLQNINPNSEYSALLAARVFSNTRNQQQLRLMLNTVIQLFEQNPTLNWRWMAEGVVIAKYHLKDLNLALTMAKKIAQLPKSNAIPAWARDLEFIMLEELNLIEAATYIVEQSLNDSSNMHPDEKRFLQQRLSALKQKSVENATKNNL